MRRFAYAQPAQVGYAAWYEQDGQVVAFEQLDGALIFEW